MPAGNDLRGQHHQDHDHYPLHRCHGALSTYVLSTDASIPDNHNCVQCKIMGKLMSYLHEWPHPMKSIDLRKLNHALAIAEAASYARASERLHLTQSALTRSIQALESELGLQLFDRGKSGVRPTVDGEKILDRARYLLLQARAF